jgi:hypothetical protein
MKRISGNLLLLALLACVAAALTGCRTLAEEDPNDQQIPWATPADWEGQLPGMPGGPGGGF